MSLGYSIRVTLNQEFNFEAIRKILNKGFDLGFLYYKFIALNKPNECDLQLLTIDEIIKEIKKDHLFSITAGIEDTYTDLFFTHDDNKLIVVFSDMSPVWSVFSEGTEDIDIKKYTKVLLDLVSDFNILQVKIEKD